MSLNSFKFALVVFLSVVLSGCLPSFLSGDRQDPEEVIRQFLDASVSAKALKDKKRLEELCIGDLRKAFEQMTDEVFQLSYLNIGVTLKDVSILDQKVTGQKARLRYRVVVENEGGNIPTVEETVREAELTLTSGRWYVDSVRPVGMDKVSFLKGMIF